MTRTDKTTDAAEPPKPAQPALRPKDAATLVVVDERGGATRILMGRRRADLVFMPGKYVFPGGRVDRTDRMQPAADDLTPHTEAMLLRRMKGRATSTRARGLALAAVREAFEETGIVVGRAAETPQPSDPATAGRAAETWSAFRATGHQPVLSPLTLFARAITPPGRARRYDTRFFLAPASAIATTTPHRDEELSHIDWFTFDEVRGLDLPVITRAIVEDLAQRLAAHGIQAAADEAMPFYYFQAGAFRRQLLAHDGTTSAPVIWRR